MAIPKKLYRGITLELRDIDSYFAHDYIPMPRNDTMVDEEQRIGDGNPWGMYWADTQAFADLYNRIQPAGQGNFWRNVSERDFLYIAKPTVGLRFAVNTEGLDQIEHFDARTSVYQNNLGFGEEYISHSEIPLVFGKTDIPGTAYVEKAVILHDMIHPQKEIPCDTSKEEFLMAVTTELEKRTRENQRLLDAIARYNKTHERVFACGLKARNDKEVFAILFNQEIIKHHKEACVSKVLNRCLEDVDLRQLLDCAYKAKTAERPYDVLLNFLEQHAAEIGEYNYAVAMGLIEEYDRQQQMFEMEDALISLDGIQKQLPTKETQERVAEHAQKVLSDLEQLELDLCIVNQDLLIDEIIETGMLSSKFEDLPEHVRDALTIPGFSNRLKERAQEQMLDINEWDISHHV